MCRTPERATDGRSRPDHHDQNLRLRPAPVRRTHRHAARPGARAILGEVIEVGDDLVKVGDIVCLPFNVPCGFCENGNKALTALGPVANLRPVWPVPPTVTRTWVRTARACSGSRGRPWVRPVQCQE